MLGASLIRVRGNLARSCRRRSVCQRAASVEGNYGARRRVPVGIPRGDGSRLVGRAGLEIRQEEIRGVASFTCQFSDIVAAIERKRSRGDRIVSDIAAGLGGVPGVRPCSYVDASRCPLEAAAGQAVVDGGD